MMTYPVTLSHSVMETLTIPNAFTFPHHIDKQDFSRLQSARDMQENVGLQFQYQILGLLAKKSKSIISTLPQIPYGLG
jgi:hypothetical protein